LVIEEVGKRHGIITVLERGPNTRKDGAQWWCRCDCGNIFINRRYDNHTENLYRYCIRSHKDLNEKIIPFFTKYKLHTSKYSQFIRFVKIMNQKTEELLAIDQKLAELN